jgi:PAS domain S-box-containing protein
MGSGIWCMHYTGMLAFRLPIPVYYHVPTVVASLLAAIAASGVALFVVSRTPMTATHLVVGSIFMGAGIATMHYTGMAAMRLGAMHYYDRNLWILSIFLAVTVSYAGLLIIYHSGGEHSWKHKAGAAFALGIAIPTMHYTGMAAVRFVAVATPPNLSQSADSTALAYVGILCVTFLVLGFASITSLVDRRLSEQQLMLESERKMLRSLIDNIPDLMYVKDTESRFVLANPEVARGIGVSSAEELIGKTEFDFLPASAVNPSYEMEQKIMRSGRPVFNHEEVLQDCLGKQTPVLTTTVPLRDSSGRITGIAGVGRNIGGKRMSRHWKRQKESIAACSMRRYSACFSLIATAICCT